mmetsp:Transcript_38556/g.88402  ORF Transcript_38556/g.88402 Transcript_38556/m.88402 type:complete len:213 (-) Transcript_38556:4-642(-)
MLQGTLVLSSCRRVSRKDTAARLDVEVPADGLEDVWDRCEKMRLPLESVAEVQLERVAWPLGRALQKRSGTWRARLLRRLLERLVLIDALKVAGVRLGGAHVLHTHMDALHDLLLAVHLVDFDANRTLVHVPYLARAAMVELVRHALLLRRIANNIDNVADLVSPQEGSERLVATLRPELLGEEVTGARAVASRALVSVTHGSPSSSPHYHG